MINIENIKRRKFRTYEELYSYLKNMSDEEYISYLDAIKNFIKSDKFVHLVLSVL